MTAHITITLDTAPPANPTLLVNGGAPVTGARVVLVTLGTSDYTSGARDVHQVKVWGDVDPTADPTVQVAEADAIWTTYAPEKAVRLSAGTGRKRLYARFRDDVCNETVPVTDFIDYDPDAPHVSVTTPADRGRVSTTAPCSRAAFAWRTNIPFSHYEVRVVPSSGSAHTAGVLIGAAHGSANTQGTGAFPADTEVETVIDGADLEAASPGDTPKIVKVFVRTSDGAWSA